MNNEASQLVNEQRQQSDAQIRDLQEKLQEQQQIFHQALEEKEVQIKEQQLVFEKKLGEQREEFHRQQRMLEEKLEEKHQEIKTLVGQHGLSINKLHIEVGVPPYEFTIANYKEKGTMDSLYFLTSPPMYTHPGGYRFILHIQSPDGVINSSHMSVGLTHDTDRATKLRFPIEFTITLQLLNQYKDQDHYKKDIRCKLTKNDMPLVSLVEPHFIRHNDLKWNAGKQTEYLKNSCLKFRVTKVCLLDR